MINISWIFRPQFFAAVGCVALLCTLSTGCGNKQAEAPPASGTGAAPATAAGPGQGKVSTGADPDKAPSYPNMYGKPAGSK